jgi:pyruvate dehydrogenase E2 component (dihydrolipoamide acetyltransferase)
MASPVSDRHEPVPAGNRLLNVGFEVTTPAHGLGLVEVNFEAAHALRERLYAERGFKLSTVVLLVKAVARALELEPQAHAFLQGAKLIRPGHVDVGVSVAGKGNFAPVAVLEAVETKPLAQLTEELRALAAQKRAEEDKALKLFGILYWVLGFDWLRRSALGLGLRRFAIARKLVGSIQVSTLPQFDLFWPLRFSSSAVVALGSIKPRPWVENGELRVAPVGRITIAIDHRVLDGWKADRFLAEVGRVLQDPAELASFV